LAAATACSGSQKSSAVISCTCWPSTPPAALTVGHRQRRAALHLLAEPGFLGRDRARHSDQNIRSSGPTECGGGKHDNDYGQ
jgi:hypothetical protein